MEVVACDTGDDGGEDQLEGEREMLVSVWERGVQYCELCLPPPSGTPWKGDPSESSW